MTYSEMARRIKRRGGESQWKSRQPAASKREIVNWREEKEASMKMTNGLLEAEKQSHQAYMK